MSIPTLIIGNGQTDVLGTILDLDSSAFNSYLLNVVCPQRLDERRRACADFYLIDVVAESALHLHCRLDLLLDKMGVLSSANAGNIDVFARDVTHKFGDQV